GVTGTTNSFTLVVTEVNRAPAFAGATNGTLPEMVGFTRTLGANDPDLPTQALTVKLEQGPTGMVLTNGVLAWTPTEAQGPSTNVIRVSVTDGVATVTNSFTLVVLEVNAPPFFGSATNVVVPEGVTVTRDLKPSDSDIPAQSITSWLVQGPAGASLAKGVFVWKTTEADGPREFTVRVAVTDGLASTTNTFSVSVGEVNSPPRFTNVVDLAVQEGSTVSRHLGAFDPDLPAQPLTLQLVQGPAGAFITNGAFVFTPTEAQGPATYDVVVTASDGSVSIARRSFKVVVSEVNQLPVIQPIANQALDEGGRLLVPVVASDADIPTQALSFAGFVQTPRGMVPMPWIEGRLAWDTTEADGPSTNAAWAVVGDGIGFVTNQFNVVVREINQPPAFVGLADAIIAVGQDYAQALVARDDDLPPQTMMFQMVQGPGGAIVTNSTLRWRPTSAQAPSTNIVRLAVSDGIAKTTNSVRIVVLTNSIESFRIAIGQRVEPGKIGGTNTAGAGEILRAGDVDEYQFEGVEGQRVYVDELTGDSTALTWVGLTPSGEFLWESQKLGTLHDWSNFPDVGIKVLPSAGTYKVRVSGVGAYSFRIVAIPERTPLRIAMTDKVTPGQVNGTNRIGANPVPSWVGRIGEPGELGTYEFEANEGQVFHFDYLQADEGWLVWWTMTGPGGEVFWDTPLHFSHGSLPWFSIPTTGVYTIQVYGYAGYTGNYGFKLLDLGLAFGGTGLGAGRFDDRSLSSLGSTPSQKEPLLGIASAEDDAYVIRAVGFGTSAVRLEVSEDMERWEPAEVTAMERSRGTVLFRVLGDHASKFYRVVQD
ncbi:MAG: hypothetical protein WCR07_16900, partial [Verrucomicrobiota bacterium]